MRAAQIQGTTPNNNDSTIVITIEANEKTPLLGGAWKQNPSSGNCAQKLNGSGGLGDLKFCDFRVLGIAVLLVGGFTIATYLLVTESRLPSARFALDLVNRDVWTQTVIPLGKLLNDSKVLHILMVQTGGQICMELYSCMDVLREMQKIQGNAHGEIPYNFLIGGDGQTYEVRGWNHESGLSILPQQSSLVIGFIGNYTFVPPTDTQCTSALSIVNESMQRKKLHSSYQVFGLRNLSISHFDGEALFNRISKWQRFVTLLNVL
ncbi:peptidoglycan-recognition protein SC2 isoform X1 [Episyrphus balteatus]|uniref:peptidoglycan-recognition protein SC2 isoform X1 n=1 Tax=Episyrphus balteatus TaxID=286459 RepID=UPI002485F6D1|nr:peptidoglycan-recognition protein SC2 isoform X1 [Episyrphus balteatus]